jgi:putative transposase
LAQLCHWLRSERLESGAVLSCSNQTLGLVEPIFAQNLPNSTLQGATSSATSANHDRGLALEALRRAVRARKPQCGLVHHSDRGSPYARNDYRRELRSHGIVASMSRRGDCRDNAVAESFFSSLKTDLTDGASYHSHADALAAVCEYIEAFYNLVRRHSYLDYDSPIQFELMNHMAGFAA